MNVVLPTLNESDPTNLIFKDEDDLLDYAFSQLDEILDLEELETNWENKLHRPDPQIQPGGIMHRFMDDEAIEAFCEDSFLDSPRIRSDGSVWAYSDFLDREIQIGWTG